MTVRNATCPLESVLSDFGLGKLDAASADSISRHIETCSDCRQRVASLSGDSFVGRLREAGGAAQAAPKRERTYLPGESLANAANSTDGSSMEDGLRGPPRSSGDVIRRDGLGSPSSVSAPPDLANHPDYELIKELGQGGMGTVYLAKNRLMGRLEVLKVISQAVLNKPGVRERFLREIQSAASLHHANIVAAYTVFRLGESLVFAMEYVKGQDLEKVVSGRGSLPVANAAFYIHQVAQGLQHAHEKGLVHRDIKPNNLMLAIEGKKHTVKILDFGLAKATSEKGSEAGLTKSGQMLGTPLYVAPEQTLDAHTADIRADIYSLGCTLYYLLSGHPPFDEPSLYALLEAHHKRDPKPLNLVRPEVPIELATVVSTMMAKDPAKRFQTPGELAKALVPFFKPGQSATAQPPADIAQPQPAAETADGLSTATPAPATAPQPIPVASALAPALPVTVSAPADLLSVSIDTRRPAPKHCPNWWRRSPPWQRWAPLGGAAAALLLGVVLLVRTPHGTIEITLSDPKASVEVTVDGDRVDIAGLDEPLSLEVGEHECTVKGTGFETRTKRFQVTRGKNSPVTISLVPTRQPAEATPKTVDSQVDPSKRFPCDIPERYRQEWSIDGNELVRKETRDGAIITFGHSIRGDYDFSVDFKRVDGNDVCGLLFGYINDNEHFLYDLGAWANTRYEVFRNIPGKRDYFASRQGSLVQNRWYRADLQVRGNQCECFLDGKSLFDFNSDALQKGRLGLYVWHCAYRFRNIVVKAPDGPVLLEGLPDLGGESPSKVQETQDARGDESNTPGFVPLFNGKDLTGWNTHPGEPANWRVEGGALRNQAGGRIFSEKTYGDFLLTLEFQVSADTCASIDLLSSPDDTPLWVFLENTRNAMGAITWDAREKGFNVSRLNPPAELRPDGQWNDMTIQLEDSILKVSLNGRQLGTGNIKEHMDHRRPGLPPEQRQSGRIALNKRWGSGTVSLRNLSIKAIGESAVTDSPKSSAAQQPTNLRSRFACEIPLWARELWSIDGEELVQKSCDRGGAFRPNMPAVCMFFGDPNWADYDFAFDAKPVDGSDLRTHFRYQDDLNNHSYAIGGFDNTWQIVDIMDGGKFGDRVVQGPLKLSNGNWYRVEIKVRGQAGTCFLDGQKMLQEFTIAKHATGRVGFGIAKADSFRFRNIVVKDPDGKVLLEGLPDLGHASRTSFPGDANLADDRKIITPTQRTDLLGLVHLPDDALIGNWRKTEQGIESDGTVGAKLQLRCRPAGEYDVRLTFTRVEGDEWMALGLCHHDARFSWWLGSHKNKCCGIASVNGWFSASNSTKLWRVPMFENGRRYTALVKVRDGSISTYLDGEQIGQELKTDYSNVNHGLDASVAPNLLAIYTASAFIIHEAEIIPVGDEPPPLAVAPFDAKQARLHQEAWARHTGAPVEQTNSIGMKLTLIPPGEFTMGGMQAEIDAARKSTSDRGTQGFYSMEAPRHLVKFTKPFYLGAYEVTQGQYKEVTGTNPSHFAPGRPGEAAIKGLDVSRHPVDTVSWPDAIDFCNKLSVKEGLPAFYARNGDKVTMLGTSGYRLPTEAEWEYACRAGSAGRWAFGDDESELPKHAWFAPNSGGRTHSVGELPPNAFGLYDMHGNCTEWVWDLFGGYSASDATDPTGAAASGGRMARGGAFISPLFEVRAAGRRESAAPGYKANFNTFRVARTISVGGDAPSDAATEPVDEEKKASVTSRDTDKRSDSRRPAKPIDLLKQLAVGRPGTVGEWRMDKGRLVFPQIEDPSIAIYDPAPEEYMLSAVVQCPSHAGGLGFGIVVGESQALVAIDSQGKTGSALGCIDGRLGKDNGTWNPVASSIIDGKLNVIEIKVRKNEVQVTCNGRRIINWLGDPSRLSLPALYAGRHSPSALFVSMARSSPFVVTKLTLRELGATDGNRAAEKTAR